jgi:cytochrome P450
LSALPAPVGLYDPFVHAMVDDPYPIYRELRREHPVYHNEERGFWALSRFADVQETARNWRSFTSTAGSDIDIDPDFFGPGDFINSDPPRHTRMRGAVKEFFTLRQLRALEPVIAARVRALLDPLIARGGGEFVSELASRLPLSVICGLLGLPVDDPGRLMGMMHDVLERTPGSSEVPRRAIAAKRELEQYVLEVAARRRERPREDVLSAIVAAEQNGDLAPDEVTGMVLLLLLAGWETSSVLAANAVWLLARHPDQRTLLIEQPSRIPAAIEEMLRFESPAQQHTRVASAEIDLHGNTIPAGERIVLLWAAANRDEDRWPDADHFRVDREPKRNLAFGEGIHHCLGAPLARLEVKVLLEEMLARGPLFDVSEPERFPGVVIRGISRMEVSWC